jgi:hypothetical protein
MYLRRVLFASSLFAAALIAAPCAHAQTRVGEAVLVKNEVVNAATTGQINVGDGVLRDETVQTGADSAARLVMADNTNLSLGANASLKLDRSVFNDEHSYRDIAIRLTTGAFRFVTGHSEKAAYKITMLAFWIVTLPLVRLTIAVSPGCVSWTHWKLSAIRPGPFLPPARPRRGSAP